MPLTVIPPTEPLSFAIERAFSDLDATFIDAHLIDEPHQRRAAHYGLDRALKIAKTETRPIIVLGFPAYGQMMVDQRFAALMGLPSVGYSQMPFRTESIRQLYHELQAGTKLVDPLAHELLELEAEDRTMASLQHGFDHLAQWPDLRPDRLNQARAAGLTGSDEEIIAQVEGWRRDTRGKFSGRYLDGIFVDVFGTLIRPDGSLNEAVRDTVTELSQSSQAPVTIWSDADHRDVERALRPYDLPWKRATKFDFRGAEVACAIDDMPQVKFEATYGITVRCFHWIDPDN